MPVFITYSDPGHGWLKAPRKLLKKMGILNQISFCSYQRGDYVYLEEDADCTLFFDTAKAQGIQIDTRHHSSNRRSKIRNYSGFCLSPEEKKGLVIEKIKEMIADDQDFLIKECERLYSCGGVDPTEYEDNFRLPKILLHAALNSLRIQRRPLNNEDCKTSKNLFHF